MNDLSHWAIYVINLDRSKDRLEALARRFAKLNIPFERVPAVDGRALDESQLEQVDRRAFRLKHGKEPEPGEIGCYLSHVRAIKSFLDSDRRYALILEDDASPPEQLKGVLEELEDRSQHWDMIKLSGVHRGTPVKVANLDGYGDICVMLTQCTGSSAYAIQRHAAQHYLAKLLPITLPYDHEFDKGWKYGLRIRHLQPFPFRHDQQNVSTISKLTNRKLRGIKRLPKHLYRIGNEIFRVVHNAFDALTTLRAKR